MLPILASYPPFDFQQAAINQVLSAYHEGLRRALVVMPTGTGKTVTFGHVADYFSGEVGRDVLILSERIGLVEQTAERMSEMLDTTCFVERSSFEAPLHRMNGRGRVISASVASMDARRLKRPGFEPERFGLLIVDEAHHAVAPTYRRVVDHFTQNTSLLALLVTATPLRYDGKSLGQIAERCVFNYPILDAVQQGYLVRPVGHNVTILSLDLSGLRRGDKDFSDDQLEKLMTEEGPLHEVARGCLDPRVGGRQTVVFTAGVAHANLLAGILNRIAGRHCAVAIDGRKPSEEVEATVRDFRAGRFQYLCNCNMATEGFDVPNIGCVAMARPTKSLLLATQMVGRGLRVLGGTIHPGMAAEDRHAAIAASGKADCLVLHFVDTARHKLRNVADVLAGDLSPIVRDLANSLMARQGGDALKVIQQARQEMLSEINRKARELFVPSVQYRLDAVDMFGDDNAHTPHHGGDQQIARGGATDKQVRALQDFGLNPETVKRWSSGKAKGVLHDKRTKGLGRYMARQLEQAGIDPRGVKTYYDGADRLRASGFWRKT